MTETLLACLTPAGTGAIATLAVRGPAAWALTGALFRPAHRAGVTASPPALPAEPAPGQSWFGQLGKAGPGGADQVIVAVKRGLPEPWLELHCHGGVQVVRLLEEAYRSRGVRVCSWQDLERASQPASFSLLAREFLAQAPTVRVAGILLDQANGAFAAAVQQIVHALALHDKARAEAVLRLLHRQAKLGRHLVDPWRVVVAGPTNVGKSSLVNALAGFSRSVVAPAPGTTRDVVTTRLAIDGWPVELADTAGWRDQADPLEEEGIALARAALGGADLCLWVLDASAPPVFPEGLPCPAQLVVNKIDLAPAWEVARACEAVHVSARTGAGIKELCATVSTRLVPHPSIAGEAVPFTPGLCERIEQAQRAVAEGDVTKAAVLMSAPESLR